MQKKVYDDSDFPFSSGKAEEVAYNAAYYCAYELLACPLQFLYPLGNPSRSSC